MKFQTIGNPNGRRGLLIHAMFVTSDSFSALVEYLKEDYFFIIPTLDGHDVNESSDFLSTDHEADKILCYLQENNIGELDFILGTSLGAIIALEVYRRNVVNINKVFLDGGPFFNFSMPVQKIAARKFWDICNKVRENPQSAEIKLNKLFPGLSSMMIDVCSNITRESVKNLAHACYSFPLPELEETSQEKITFLYGTREPARLCICRLKRYKYSCIIRKAGYSHCGYLLSHPGEYAEILKGK